MIRPKILRLALRGYYFGIILLCLTILIGDIVSLFIIPEWSPKIALQLSIISAFAIGRMIFKSVRLKIAEWHYMRMDQLIILPPLHYEVKKQSRPKRVIVRTIVAIAVLVTTFVSGSYVQSHHLLPLLSQAKASCAATPSPMPKPTNDVPNFSMENTFNPWNKKITGQNDARFAYDGSGYNSSHSLAVTITNYHTGNAGWLYPVQPAVSGNTYHYADWYKSSSATALVLVYIENGLTVYRTIDNNIPASLDWRHYSTSFDIPDNQGPSDTIPVSVMHVLTSTGSLNIDDVVFHQKVDSFVRPLISITFDDGFRGQYTHGLPLLCKYHIPATFFLISDYVLKGYADYMQPSMVGTLIKDGMEIGDHTVDHHSLRLLSPEQTYWEIHQSKVDLEQQFGIHITDFASPYGDVNDSVLAQIRGIYQTHRSTDVGLNTASEFDPYNIMCVTRYANEGTTVADIKGWIDRAIKTKTWLVLAFHMVDGTSEKYYESRDPYNASPEFLEQVLAYVASNKIQPVTINQALSEVEQQV